jgi:hypothetical protein
VSAEFKGAFKGDKYMCVKCKDIIYSRYQGEFVTCKCGAISVDQTRFYTRQIGNRGDFLDVPENTDPWPFPTVDLVNK